MARLPYIPRRFVFAALLAAGLCVAAGCGKKGPPRPPEPRSPRLPESVAVRQIGSEIRIWFTVPTLRGPRPSQALQRADLIRVDYAPGFSPPPDPDAFNRRGQNVGALTGGLKTGDRLDLGDADLDALENGGVGATLRYAVQLFDVRGRPSTLVAAPDLLPLEVLPAPVELSGEATGDGIRIRWEPPPGVTPPPAEPAGETGAAPDPVPATEVEDPAQDADAAEEDDAAAADDTPRFKYNVYRGAPDQPAPEMPINPIPLTDTEYLDDDPQEGEQYRYVVRLLLADGPPVRESASSLPVVVLAKDVIAPGPPQGLVAVQEGSSVRLFWHPNEERDVAGYRVYRRVGSGRWVAIGPDRVEQMTFQDRDVVIGQLVAYRVTAIDRATPPNESAPSELAELTVVAEPTAPGQRPPGDR